MLLLLTMLSAACALPASGQRLTEKPDPVGPWTICGPVQTALDIAGHDAAKAKQAILANRNTVTKPTCGWFALDNAVTAGDFEIVKALIEAGVNPNSFKGVLNSTAIHCRDDIAAATAQTSRRRAAGGR